MAERKISPEYTAFSQVKPQGPRDPTERIHIDFPEVKISDAVGRAMSSVGEHGFGAASIGAGAVAHALDNLGEQVDKTGNKLWERAQGLQELQNQNALSKAELEFDKYVATKQSQFENLKGEAATEDTYKAYVKDLEDQAKKLGAGLPPKTLEQYNRSTRDQIGKRGIAAAGHVASEYRQVTISTSEAKVNNWKDQLSKTEDIKETKELIEKIEQEVWKTQVPARGWSAEKGNEVVRKHVGEGYIGQLLNMSRTNPWQALRILDNPDNKGLWDDKQYLAAKTHITNDMTRISARNLGNDIHDSNPDGNLDEKVEEAKKRAAEEEKRTGVKLPDLEKETIQNVRTNHTMHKTSVEEKRRDDNETVSHVIDGKLAGADGKRPKNKDQLFSMGGDAVRKAFYDLPVKDRDKYEEKMRKHALGIEPPTEESEAVKDTMWGMRMDDPARFRDLDLNHVEGLRLADKDRLKEEQKRIRKEGINLQDDPRIGRAINDAKNAGIIDKKLMQNPQAYSRFKGAYREAVIAAQTQQGFEKPLTEEQHKQIADMVKSKVEVPGWFGKSQAPFYESIREVPKAILQRLRAEIPGITDEAALSEYRREMSLKKWNELYKGKK